MARIGVDVGGTFTDLVLEKMDKNDCAKVFVHKVASTPHDQSVGVLRGVLEICEQAGVKPSDITMIVHGTTFATNITIEHNGAEVGMLTTRGFRDILHIGRHKRPHNFSPRLPGGGEICRRSAAPHTVARRSDVSSAHSSIQALHNR